MDLFIWDDINIDHIARHDVLPFDGNLIRIITARNAEAQEKRLYNKRRSLK